MTLTEFLLARIAEDEAVAQAATRGPWFAVASGVEGSGTVFHDKHVLHNDAAHIALHDPVRVLRRCEADRRIVERASRSVVTVTSQRPSPFGNLSFSEGRYYAADGRDVTDEFAAWHAVDGEPKDPTALRILAAVYADHPDYREEWKP